MTSAYPNESRSFADLAAEARKTEQHALDLLRKLIQFPSVAAREGTAIRECADWIEGLFTSRGFRAEVFETGGSPVVFAEKSASAPKTILFYHHYDVQPEDPIDLWHSPPFDLEVRDDRVFGRGAVDNKGPFIATLLGVELAERVMEELPVNVKFVVEGEEEAGSKNLHRFVDAKKAHLQADGCFMELATCTPGTSSEIYCGSKGMVSFELVTMGPPAFARSDVHSGFAGVVPNAVWHLVRALNSLKDGQENILIEGLEEMVREPSSSDIETLRQYRGDMEERVRTDFGLGRALLDRTGLEFLGAVFLRPTLTVTGISGGYEGSGSRNIVPSSASAKLEIRLVPDMTAERTERLLRDHLLRNGFGDIEVNRSDTAYDPSKTPTDHPFVRMVDEVAAEASAPARANVFPMAFGTGPGYLFEPYAPSCLCLSSAELRGTNMHAPDENWPLSSMFNGMAFVAAVMDMMRRSP